MNEHDTTHGQNDELLAYVCGELDDAGRRRVEAAIAGDASLAADASRLRGAIDGIAPAGAASISPQFNDRLRTALQGVPLVGGTPQTSAGNIERTERHGSAEDSRPVVSRRRFLPRIPSLAAAAIIGFAAGVLLLFVAGSPRGPLSPSVAWADVVKAVEQVQQMHITLLERQDDRDVAIEIFFHRPDSWRAQGAGTVQFVSRDGEKIFDLSRMEFVKPEDAPLRALPPADIRKYLTQGNVLEGLIKAMYDGQLPAGEPVKAAAESLQGDVEVFDYVGDASGSGVPGLGESARARVWVLKNSRLPIRVQIHHGDETIDASFSYADPQPAAFFDADAFAKEVKERGLTKAGAIYHVGEATPPPATAPAARKKSAVDPATQPFNKPVVQSLFVLPTGEVAITVEGQMNRYSKAFEELSIVDERFGTFTDTRGVVYAACGPWGFGTSGRYHNTLLLIPVSTGAGDTMGASERRLHGRFMLTISTTVHPLNWPNAVGVMQNVVAGEYDLPLPAPLAADDPSVKGLAEQFPQADRRVAARDFLLARLPLMRQPPILDRWIADEPASVDAVVAKMERLLMYGRQEQAYALLESTVRDALLDAAPGDHRKGNYAGNYLFYLAQHGRAGEVAPLVARLEAKRKALLDAAAAARGVARPSAEQRSALAAADWIHRNEAEAYNALPAAMQIPAALAQLDAAPKPAVKQLIRSEDRHILIQLVMPPAGDGQPQWRTSDGAGREWEAVASGPATQPAQAGAPGLVVYRGEAGAFAYAFAVTPPALLTGKLAPQSGEYWLPWSFKIDLPKPSVPSMREWTHAHAPTITWPDLQNDPGAIQDAADRALARGEAQQALELYDRGAAIPVERWPADLRNPANAALADRLRLELPCGRARALVRLGRTDDARAAFDAIAGTLPAPYRPERLRDASLYTIYRHAKLEWVRDAMARHDLATAQQCLTQIERDRPNLLPLDDAYVTEFYPNHSVTTRGLFFAVRDQWHGVDQAWWDLREAMGVE